MPIPEPAETWTALSADTSNLKPSTDAACTRQQDSTNGVIANSSDPAIAESEVILPVEATPRSFLDTGEGEGIIATGDLPLFLDRQPKDRAIPPPSPEEYEAIKANVGEVGRIRVPILITPSGAVIDGYTRLQIAIDLDIPCPWAVEHIADDQIRSLARTIALARRNLTADQKRQLIEDELIEDAEGARLGEDRRSFNTIAKKLGVACNTVISAARKLIERGEIPAITESVGADGKVRKARQSRNSDTGVVARPETAPTLPMVASTMPAVATAEVASDSPASVPFAATAEAAPQPASETVEVRDRVASMTPTEMGPEPVLTHSIDPAMEVEFGLVDQGVEGERLATPTTVDLPESEPDSKVATEVGGNYLPEEHPLSEAIRLLFRSRMPDAARITVERLLSSPASDVTLDDVDAVMVRCGLGRVTIMVA